jgi:hypothetical protein
MDLGISSKSANLADTFGELAKVTNTPADSAYKFLQVDSQRTKDATYNVKPIRLRDSEPITQNESGIGRLIRFLESLLLGTRNK